MKSRGHQTSKLMTALSFVLLGVLWIVFAPVQFGGQASYVIVNGNSMEPLYHRGDLVIIRAQPDYQIGDIVTYRHPEIGPVIHRIIGRDIERYVFRGDHNDFIDPYRPLRADLIGKSWIYIPSVGSVLTQIRTPLNMAIIALLVGVMIMAPMFKSNDQATSKQRGRRQQKQTQSTPSQEGSREGVFLALGLLAIASIALAVFAFTRPLTRDVPSELTYQQRGVFSYSASAPAGIYDSETIQTGEPLFLQLTKTATVAFDYQLEVDQPGNLQGTYRLVAELSAANGWRRTIELAPETSFSGSSFQSSGTLDLAQIQELASHFEQQTGLLRQQYTLAIVPDVHITGTLAGQPFQEAYAPQLKFRLDQTQLQLMQESGKGQDVLKPSQAGLLKSTQVKPNVITLLFLTLEVPLARGVGLGALAVACLIAYLFGLRMVLHPARIDEAARIKSKYGALLIDVASDNLQPGERGVTVAAIDDLAKLAEKYGSLILHEQVGSTHRYSIHADSLCYSYQCVCMDVVSAAPAQQPTASATPAPDTWQAAFLDTLREKGTISEACRSANIDIAVAYDERLRAPAFAQAWTDARTTLRETLLQKGDQP